MNQLDVAGLLYTYSLKAKDARDTKQLQRFMRELKSELNADTIKKMEVFINENNR